MAQAPKGTRRVAVLLSSNPTATAQWLKSFVGGLSELGWVERRNLSLDIRYAEGDAARFRPLVAELLGMKPDVLLASIEPVAREAVALTKTVPIIFALGFDPVGTGLVQSFARPGGNVTGLSVLNYELVPKRLALLKEAVPGLTRVAVMYRAADRNADRVLQELVEPARTLKLSIIPAEVRDAGALEGVFAQLVRQKAGGIVAVPDVFFFQNAPRIMDLAAAHGLVSIFPSIEYAKAGALLSYGTDYTAVYRRCAALVDKILKGANPASIPVEQANVYELAVNLKTARRLGIALPRTLLLQATQTIE